MKGAIMLNEPSGRQGSVEKTLLITLLGCIALLIAYLLLTGLVPAPATAQQAFPPCLCLQ
jgi:hypothetical protein